MTEPMEIEQAVLDRLVAEANTKNINVAIELSPENENEYNLIHPLGAILIRYDSSSDEPPTGTQFKTHIEIHVIVLAKNLRSSEGMYGFLAFVRASLTGWMPSGFGRMYRSGEQLIGRENDLWQFGQRYIIETINLLGT